MKNFLIQIVLFVFILLSGFDSANAVLQGWEPPEDYGDGDSFEIGMESEEVGKGMGSESEELNMDDIFGDEQVFPFPPGLGN
tara:strand:+ start:30 stop:275 length:246 start_codon:yes stop_codon:yes gene_type:complete